LSSAYINSTATLPGPLAGFIDSVSPVTWGGQPVVLSATVAKASNYPDPAIAALFNNAAKGNLTAGGTTIAFGAYATLVHQESFGDAYGGGTTVVQTWEITSDGTINGIRTATVEITSTIETPKVPAFQYA